MDEFEQTQNHTRKISLKMLMKGTSIIMLAPLMIMIILVLYGRMAYLDAILALLAIFVISIIFVRPYLTNLSALTNYVQQLSEDKKAMPPDLSFLNNVEELSEAVERLQNSWEIRKDQLEGYLAESKILIDNLPNILILLDENMNVIQTNNAARSTFRYNGLKETLDYIINDSTIHKIADQVLAQKEGKSVDFRLPEPISREYIVRVERFPVFSPRGITLILLMQDITEIKQTEQTFADFVANASHEIRTPLTTIVGFIETLRTTGKDDEEARDKFLELMDEQAERMSRLVKDLLSLSQIEKKLTTRPTERINIRAIVNDTIKQFEWSAKEKNMEIEKKLAKKIPEIIGDEDDMELVIYNLINNAIKYGKENSQIKVAVSVTDNTLDDMDIFKGRKKLLLISVADEGEGIPKEHLPRLTERFYRVDKARSRKIGGTGLGLSIVKHILDRHQGVLSIESEVGVGSTFTVWLPVAE